MAERKVVGRKLAIVLGVVSVILAVGLVIALVAYLPASAQVSTLNAQIAEKDQTIAALNLQITSLRNTITSLNANLANANASTAQVTTLQNQIASLQAENADLYNVLYLNATGVLVNSQAFTQEPYTNVTIWDGSQPLQYAGYVTVQIQSSSNLTYVELFYNSLGVVYDNVVTLGNGTAAFPVLPGSVVIVLGNNEPTDRVTGTVTALYYY